MNVYSLSQLQLYEKGVELATKFLLANAVSLPKFRQGPLVTFRAPSGSYGCGAHYQRNEGLIWVNADACARPAKGNPRQRSFPGYTSDRTPIGVVTHEAGHHVDWRTSTSKVSDWQKLCKREKVSSYEPYPHEAFAETMRLYILNPALLKSIAPNRYAFLGDRFYTVVSADREPWDVLHYFGATPYMIDAAKAKAT